MRQFAFFQYWLTPFFLFILLYVYWRGLRSGQNKWCWRLTFGSALSNHFWGQYVVPGINPRLALHKARALLLSPWFCLYLIFFFLLNLILQLFLFLCYAIYLTFLMRNDRGKWSLWNRTSVTTIPKRQKKNNEDKSFYCRGRPAGERATVVGRNWTLVKRLVLEHCKSETKAW